MNNDDLIKKLISIINNYSETYKFELNELSYKKTIELDSIDFTNFILDLEKEFGIEISEKDLNKFKNLKTIVNMLKKKLQIV